MFGVGVSCRILYCFVRYLYGNGSGSVTSVGDDRANLSAIVHLLGPPGVLGIWGEGLFIFRELGSTANYFRGAGEQAHTFGDLGSTAKK